MDKASLQWLAIKIVVTVFIVLMLWVLAVSLKYAICFLLGLYLLIGIAADPVSRK